MQMKATSVAILRQQYLHQHQAVRSTMPLTATCSIDVLAGHRLYQKMEPTKCSIFSACNPLQAVPYKLTSTTTGWPLKIPGNQGTTPIVAECAVHQSKAMLLEQRWEQPGRSTDLNGSNILD